MERTRQHGTEWKNIWHGMKIETNQMIFPTFLHSNRNSESFFNRPIYSKGNRPRTLFKDLAYYVLNLPWLYAGITISMLYFGIILLFALVYHYICNESDDLLDGFNLSYQAFSTIGFGIVYSRERCGNYTIVIESIVSMVMLPTIAGIIFTKFSLPKVKIAFSDVCCIQPNYKGKSGALIVRVANASSSQDLDVDVIMDATFAMELYYVDRSIQPAILRRCKLPLKQSDFIFFRLALELVHVIDTNSPLYRIPFTSDCMVHVTISGVDSNRHATIVNQRLYTYDKLRDGFRFTPMVYRDSKHELVVEFQDLNSIVELPDVSTSHTDSFQSNTTSLISAPSWNTDPEPPVRSDIAPFVEDELEGFLFKQISTRSVGSNVISEASYIQLDDAIRHDNNRVMPKHVPHIYQYLYYHILHAKWRTIVFGIVVLVGIFTLTFAILHWIHFDDGLAIMSDMRPPINSPFELCLYLSLHTFSTIGYGNIGPAAGDRYHNALVAVEAMIGLTVAAVLTGIFWSKFALPQAHIQFSSSILHTIIHGHRCLVFRVVNTRRVGDIQMCQLKLGAFFTDSNGARRMHDLPLIQPHWPTVNIPVTLIHVIDSSSPLTKYAGTDDISSISMLALFSGFDSTFCETIYARRIYSTYDIDRSFDDAIQLTSSHLQVDWSKVDLKTQMGAANGVLQAEAQRPLDGSDINTPRGETAKQEVIRLRALLAAQCNAAATSATSSYSGLPPLFARYAERIFLEVDTDQSGYLNYYELWTMIQEKMNLGLTPENIEALKIQSGLESGNDVSWQQFLSMLPELLKLQLRQSEASAADWCELTTETGAVYYYNKRTQISQWEKPTWDLPADMQGDMISVFQAADADGSGYLSWDEFKQCLRHQLELQLSEDQLISLQSQIVLDPERGVSWNDFVNAAPDLLSNWLVQRSTLESAEIVA